MSSNSGSVHHSIGIQLSSPSNTNIDRAGYRTISDVDDVDDVDGRDSNNMDHLVMDVDDPEGLISRQEKKGYKNVAMWGGICIVMGVVLLFSGRVAIEIFMPSIKIYQTSLLWESDRLTLLDSAAMRERGFDVGDVAFGNTDCNKLMKMLNTVQGQKCSPPKDEDAAHIYVNRTRTYQSIIGFGGAFTEAAATNFYSLPPPIQTKLINAYFGEGGIGYTLGRIPINSCDFSVESYSFDEVKGDYDLLYFDTELTHDSAFMMPFMRRAMSAVQSINNDNKEGKGKFSLNFLASPWSPPKWMKQPIDGVQSMNGSALPNGLILDVKTKAAWASYITKWVQSYKEKGIPIWAVTPQNEPEFPAPWEACVWSNDEMRDWIIEYLGPILKKAHPDILLLAFDHNKDHLLTWANSILGNQDAAKWVDGMAFHWYTGAQDRMLDGTYGYNNLNETHARYPDKMLLGTEGCSCPGVRLDDWKRAEMLGHDILFDIANYAQGWIDWNLIVDANGGINHVGNNCDAPIIANPDFTDIHIQPTYYYMGHISKYVPPGSIRIDSQIVGNYEYNKNIDANVRSGYEMSVWPCEKSTRQMFKLTEEGYIQLSTVVLDAEANLAAATNTNTKTENNEPEPITVQLCMSMASHDTDRQYLKVIECHSNSHSASTSDSATFNANSGSESENEKKDQSTGPLIVTYDRSTGLLRVKHEYSDAAGNTTKSNPLCVSLADSTFEAGALLNLQTCVATATTTSISTDGAHQIWNMHENTGEISILHDPNIGSHTAGTARGLCLTAGWPFLTGLAFHSPELDVDNLNSDSSHSSPFNTTDSGSSTSTKRRTASSDKDTDTDTDTDDSTVNEDANADIHKDIVVIIMNEAAYDVKIILHDEDEARGTAWFGINGRSMQTIVYDQYDKYRYNTMRGLK